MKIMIVEPFAPRDQTQRLADIFSDPRHYNNPESLYKVETISCGDDLEKAYETFADQHPDVILIDIDAAQAETFTFCERIRTTEKDRHTGFVCISRSKTADDGILELVLEHGGDDFIDGKASEREIVARINSVFRFKMMTDRLRSANHHLKILSLTDELTGLNNMRSFALEYQKRLKACRKGETGLGVIMLDLDHFKRINDSANHLVGSYIIGEVGRLISDSGVLRPESVAARYGGDEYIVCVPTHSVAELWDITEKIRDLIQRSVFKKEQYSLKLTGSLGLAWVQSGFDGKPDELIKAADLMLYRSKRNGRNMVSGMFLHYPIDFNQIGSSHLIDRESLSTDAGLCRPSRSQ